MEACTVCVPNGILLGSSDCLKCLFHKFVATCVLGARTAASSAEHNKHI